MIMNKVDVNVKPSEFWEVNHQDRRSIDMLLEERLILAAQDKFLSTFKKDIYVDNPVIRLRDYLRGVHDQNPLLEIILSCLHKLPVHGGPLYWEWYDEDVRDFGFNMNRTAIILSRMEVSHEVHHDSPHHQVTETVNIRFRGHGCGRAFQCGFWDFLPRTCNLFCYLKPLLEDMSNGDDLSLIVEYQSSPRNRGSWRTHSTDRFELINVRLVCGDLVLQTFYFDSSAFSRICGQINHSVINIMNRKIGNKARKAMFVCSQEETMFHLEYDPKLQSMMEGGIPTEEELMMMSIAGYENEFWLDNIKSFDRLTIKPFNLDEAVKCYQQKRVVFKL